MSETNGKRNGKTGKPSETGADGNLLVIRDPATGRILPGSNLNPTGNKRGYATRVRLELQRIMDEPTDGDREKRTKLDILLRAVYAKAVRGDMNAARLILDRILPASFEADVTVSGMTANAVIDVFALMRADYVKSGRLPEIGGD